MPSFKFIFSSLTLAILIALTATSNASAQQPLRSQPATSSPTNQWATTLESQTKKITPLATPSITINPQPTPQTPVSEPFWTSLSRCSIAGRLSCTSASAGAFILIGLISIAFWIKRLSSKKLNQSNQ